MSCYYGKGSSITIVCSAVCVAIQKRISEVQCKYVTPGRNSWTSHLGTWSCKWVELEADCIYC